MDTELLAYMQAFDFAISILETTGAGTRKSATKERMLEAVQETIQTFQSFDAIKNVRFQLDVLRHAVKPLAELPDGYVPHDIKSLADDGIHSVMHALAADWYERYYEVELGDAAIRHKDILRKMVAEVLTGDYRKGEDYENQGTDIS